MRTSCTDPGRCWSRGCRSSNGSPRKAAWATWGRDVSEEQAHETFRVDPHSSHRRGPPGAAMTVARSDRLACGEPHPLAHRYEQVRRFTTTLAAPLTPEDCQVQSMPDASPTKWHLAHVTWFFETFVLERYERAFAAFDPGFRVLFNSYYQRIGEQHPRPQRGLITRPTLETVKRYRANVDERMLALLAQPHDREVQALVTLGLHHEQQHQ